MGTWKLAREHTQASDLEYVDSDRDDSDRDDSDEAEQAQVACLYTDLNKYTQTCSLPLHSEEFSSGSKICPVVIGGMLCVH